MTTHETGTARTTETKVARVNALGAFIAQRLDDRQISRTRFAIEAGMSRSSVYRLLGDEPPERLSAAMLERFATILDVDPDALIALWGGSVYASLDGQREDLVRGFVLSTADLSTEELRHALEVARAAVQLSRTMRDERGS